MPRAGRARRRRARAPRMSWAPMSVDEERGLVFLPTTSPARISSAGAAGRQSLCRIPSSRCTSRPDRSPGRSRSRITMCGTTMFPRSRRSALVTYKGKTAPRRAADHQAGPGLHARSRRPASRSFRSKNARVPQRRRCPANSFRRRSRFPLRRNRSRPPHQAGRCVRPDILGSRRSAATRSRSARARGHLHAAVDARHDPLSVHRRRHRIGAASPSIPRTTSPMSTRRARCISSRSFRARISQRSKARPSATRKSRRNTGTPYGMMRETLLSPLGMPCNPPPWGQLHAIDMHDGHVLWEVPLGTTEDLLPFSQYFSARPARPISADRS